jgi:hypothetical protein
MIGEIRDWYLKLPNQDKVSFLASVAHHLTVHGRAFILDLSADKLTEAFKGLNELHHQISQQIVAIGLERKRYSDDALWDILIEKAAQHGISICFG